MFYGIHIMNISTPYQQQIDYPIIDTELFVASPFELPPPFVLPPFEEPSVINKKCKELRLTADNFYIEGTVHCDYLDKRFEEIKNEKEQLEERVKKLEKMLEMLLHGDNITIAI